MSVRTPLREAPSRKRTLAPSSLLSGNELRKGRRSLQAPGIPRSICRASNPPAYFQSFYPFATECCGGPSQSHFVPKSFIGLSWTEHNPALACNEASDSFGLRSMPRRVLSNTALIPSPIASSACSAQKPSIVDSLTQPALHLQVRAFLTREITKSCKVMRRLSASFFAFHAKSSGMLRRFHVGMNIKVAYVCAVVNVGSYRNICNA
jgi:hypothetical protein